MVCSYNEPRAVITFYTTHRFMLEVLTTATHKPLARIHRSVSIELRRHVNALVSDFTAEYGEVDLVSRRVECDPGEYDALVDSFESFGVVGGAGIRLLRDQAVLLARYENVDGWIEPGAGRLPGESYSACAKRGLRELTDAEASIDGLAQIQVVYLDDWTERQPIPNPYVAFRGSVADGAATSGGTTTATLRWAAESPDELAYEELSELLLGSGEQRI